MADKKYCILESTLTNIADAIRAKTGDTAKIDPDDMPDAIEGIKGGENYTVLEGVEVALYLSGGDQLVSLPDGVVAKSATIKKPATLIPENIVKDVEIAGVVGTHAGGGGGSAEGCVTVTFKDGDEVLFERQVFIGDDCPDPVSKGIIARPTKDSTVSTVYTFSGWSGSLKDITEDTTFEAVYNESVRKYTVRFYDGDTLLCTEEVPYGGSSEYVYNKNGYTFGGWAPAPSGITTTLDCYGTWVESGEIQDSWDDIVAAANDGTYASKYNVGMYKPLDLGDDGVVNMQIVAFDADSGKNGSLAITWVAKELLANKAAIHGDSSAVKGFPDTDICLWLNSTLKARMPMTLQNGIKAAYKRSRYSPSATANDVNIGAHLDVWIPCLCEIGLLLAGTEAVVDPTYSAVFFDEDSRKKCLAGADTPTIWWTRDDHNHTRNYHITADGIRSSADQKTAQGICIGFCI